MPRPSENRPLDTKDPAIGSFLYFGVIDSLLLRSPGITAAKLFRRILKIVQACRPGNLCQELLKLIGVDEDEAEQLQVCCSYRPPSLIL